jgi:citrate lyase beta subunit
MKLFFITNSAELAQFAIAHGVDRIFVDLEILGKVERQGHLNTVISRHSLADVASLRAVVPAGRLLVRINPIHDGSVDEIERVIASGADILMLPMFRTPREVEAFTTAVAGRVRTCLLVETVGAMESLRACVSIPGVDEVHIGLNDLHLEMG